MESIYSIIAGLGLRYVVDTVSRHDFKITGTVVGLWEGVILLHFLKKLPKSTDPYLAFAVRLFIDFVVTESVSRLVLVLTWTGMGMILADVAPAVWEDSGLRRVWRRFRRDLYIISESVPTVVFFPPTRTVRFSPSREPSVIAEADEEEEPDGDTHTEARSADSSTSAGMTDRDASANIESVSIRRRLPGYFPGMLSDTESVLSSVVSRDIPLPSTFQRDSERTSRRLSIYPIADDFASETSSQRNEEDDIKLSSSASSQSTVTGPADTTRFTDDIRLTDDFDTTQITDIPDEEVLEEQKQEKEKAEEIAKKDQYPEEETGPRQTITLFLPPTPSDSLPPQRRRLPKVDQLRPSSASIPQIPDLPEDLPSDGPSDGWENIQREDATDTEIPWEQVQREDAIDAEKPPPPPPKDLLDMNRMGRLLATTSTNANDHGLGDTNNNEYRYSQPPPYFDHVDDHDDIYEDHPSDRKVPGAVAGDTSIANMSTLGGGQQVDETRVNEQRKAEDTLQQEAAEKKRQEEAAEQRRKDEEAEKMKTLEEEAAEQRRKDEEAERTRRLEEEAAEQRRKDEEAERTRRLEEEAAEQRRKDEEAEKTRKLEEEAAEQRRRDEEAEKTRRLEEEAAEQRRRDEEAEKTRILEEEAAVQRRKDEEAKRTRILEEEAEKSRLVEVAAERKRLEESAEKRRKDEEKRLDELERKRKEDAAEKQRKDAEAEKSRLEELEKKRIEAEAAEARRQEEMHNEQQAERVEKQRKETQIRLEEERIRKGEEETQKRSEEEAEKSFEGENAAKKAEEEMAEKKSEEEMAEKNSEEEVTEKEPEEETAGTKPEEGMEEKQVDHDTESRQAMSAPTPSTSALAKTQSADAQPSLETEAPANEEAGNDEPDDGEQHRMETESVATEQSTIPTDVESRLSRILLTKAQIVEIQSRMDVLGAQDTADGGTLHDLRKVLEKLKRKERRGREEGLF